MLGLAKVDLVVVVGLHGLLVLAELQRMVHLLLHNGDAVFVFDIEGDEAHKAILLYLEVRSA